MTLPLHRIRWKPRRLLPFCGRPAQMLDLLVLGIGSLGLLVVQRGDATGLLERSVPTQALLGAVLCVIAWRVTLLASGIYTPERMRSLLDYVLRAVIGLNSCALMTGLILVILHAPGNLWHWVELFWGVSLLGMVLVRAALLGWYGWMRPRLGRPRRVIVVGSGHHATQVVAELEADSSLEYDLVGFVDSDPQEGFVPRQLILGGIDDLEQILMQQAVDEVVIALPMKSQYEAVGYAIAVCQMLGVRSQYLTDRNGEDEERPPMRSGATTPVRAGSPGMRVTGWMARAAFLRKR